MDRLSELNPAWQDGKFEDFIKAKHGAYVVRLNGKDMATTFGRMFARFLSKHELQYEARTGKKRTLYSLRHYYATMALTYDRMTIYTLSKQMGTSVTMIEQHYGHVQLRKKAHAIAGGKRLV